MKVLVLLVFLLLARLLGHSQTCTAFNDNTNYCRLNVTDWYKTADTNDWPLLFPPRSIRCDFADSHFANSKHGRQVLLQNPHLNLISYGPDLDPCKFRVSVFLSAKIDVSPFLHFVLHVYQGVSEKEMFGVYTWRVVAFMQHPMTRLFVQRGSTC